ncbi:MAG: hypothetical protein HYV65_00100 [Candidatus Spechtbacteria bacterium]|nr:hypothetical protein [Candidatus Spechtbacteria bacterium]
MTGQITVNGLNEGIARISQSIGNYAIQKTNPLIVGIAGASGSGKTVLSKLLQQAWPGSAILAADDYFYGKRYMRKHNLVSFDDPNCVNLQLIAEHLASLKRGEAIQKSIYSFNTGEPEDDLVSFACAPIIFVEGIFVLMEPTRSMLDLTVFVEAGVHGTFWRRIVRDIERTRQSPLDIAGVFINNVYPAYKKFILPTRECAQIIVINDMFPGEMQKILSMQYQLRGCIASPYDAGEYNRILGILAAAGFKSEKKVLQHDKWLVPPSNYDISDEELIRVRAEYLQLDTAHQHLTLTYKTPADSSPRGVLEFSITSEIIDGLIALGYRSGRRRLKKERVMYHKKGINNYEIALDSFITNDDIVHLWLEVRGDTIDDLHQCLKLLSNLGVQQSKFVATSYRSIIALI